MGESTIVKENRERVVIGAAIKHGSCGAEAFWRYDEEGTLTVFGKGAMEDFLADSPPVPNYVGKLQSRPWLFLDRQIRKIVVCGGITRIGDNAFHYTSEAEEAVIPETVREIGIGAFELSNLKTVTLPKSLKSLGGSAFANCRNLEQVMFPEGLETIGSGAFRNCRSLTHVEFPASLKEIKAQAFRGCPLQPVDLPENCVAEQAFDDTIAVTYPRGGACGPEAVWRYDGNGTLVISGRGPMTDFPLCGSYWYHFRNEIRRTEVADGITRIGDYAFDWIRLEEITLPETLLEIGMRAFASTNLKTVVLPKGLKGIGRVAFSECKGLETVTLPDSLVYLDYQAFGGCSFSQVDVPPNCLDRGAFDDAVTVRRPHSGSCGAEARWQFDGKETLTISGRGAMTDYGMEQNPWQNFANQIRKVQVNSGITRIGTFAFFAMEITDVVFPNTLLEIGYEAFVNTKLKAVVLPGGLREIGGMAFAACRGLETVTFPGSLEKIGVDAFARCALRQVTIPKHCQAQRAFDDAVTVLHWNLPRMHRENQPQAVRSVLAESMSTLLFRTRHEGEFWDHNVLGICCRHEVKRADSWDCEHFTDESVRCIIVEEGTEEIRKGVFEGLPNLSEIFLPSTVRKIEPGALPRCRVHVSEENLVFRSVDGVLMGLGDVPVEPAAPSAPPGHPGPAPHSEQKCSEDTNSYVADTLHYEKEKLGTKDLLKSLACMGLGVFFLLADIALRGWSWLLFFLGALLIYAGVAHMRDRW